MVWVCFSLPVARMIFVMGSLTRPRHQMQRRADHHSRRYSHQRRGVCADDVVKACLAGLLSIDDSGPWAFSSEQVAAWSH